MSCLFCGPTCWLLAALAPKNDVFIELSLQLPRPFGKFSITSIWGFNNWNLAIEARKVVDGSGYGSASTFVWGFGSYDKASGEQRRRSEALVSVSLVYHDVGNRSAVKSWNFQMGPALARCANAQVSGSGHWSDVGIYQHPPTTLLDTPTTRPSINKALLEVHQRVLVTGLVKWIWIHTKVAWTFSWICFKALCMEASHTEKGLGSACLVSTRTRRGGSNQEPKPEALRRAREFG